MRTFVLVIGLVLAVGILCVAQEEIPRSEVYLGYSFLRVNSAISVPAFTANGGLASFQYNFNKHIAGVGEFGGQHNGNIGGFHLDSTMYTYLFGPRVSLYKESVISPFFHTLFGAMHYTRSFRAPAGITTPNGRIDNSQQAFAMAVGGGLDVKIAHGVALRPVQLDYLLTRFQPLFIAGIGEINRDRNQNNLRYSAGVAFHF